VSVHESLNAHRVATGLTVFLLLAIAACGGGGGGGNEPPSSASPPPAQPAPDDTGDEPEVPSAPVAHVSFVDATAASGIDFLHGFERRTTASRVVGGVAVGDYNGDGWLDIYLAQGDAGFNRLYENRSQGGSYTFVDVTEGAGVAGAFRDKASGPAFVDYDGDGDEDLFVGSVENTPFRVFDNLGDGTFSEVTVSAGLGGITRENSVGLAFGDYDQDSDLDMFMAHWTFTPGELPQGTTQHLWRNNGDGTFSDVSEESLVSDIIIEADFDYTFAPTFADIDDDGDLDLLVAADAGTSQVLLNQGDLGGGLYTFSYATDRNVITDRNGMGSSVADFDNDGDLDWFVTAISLGDPPENRPTPEDNAGFDLEGNRFYRNEGNGVFSDQTESAGVRKGYWGWASCAADFNNDGYLDIFHVNGMDEPATNAYLADPSRLFINNGDGTFTEYAEPLGLVDRRMGRGVICFDGDKDGDIDILAANSGDTARLFRNDGGNELNFLSIELRNDAPNTRAAGARVYVTVGNMTQLREVHNGNNFVSQNPAEQHFGLNDATQAESVRVIWPDGTETSRTNISSNQRLTVTYPDSWSSD
jgi:hypothetical protein